MANKKCIYCGETMYRVIRGMPTQDELENPKPMTEYAGCIIGPLTPKWQCQICGYKVLPQANPSSGICIQEAPDRVVRSFETLVERIVAFASPVDHHEQLIELVCPLQISNSPDDEALVDHKQHGDHINIHVCSCHQIKVFLDGAVFGMTTERKGLYHGHLEERFGGYIDLLPSFTNLPKRVPELLFGNALFEELIDLIGFHAATGCAKDGEHEDLTGDWAILADYWEQREFQIPPEASPVLIRIIS